MERIRACVCDGGGLATAAMRSLGTKEVVQISAMVLARHWRHSWLLLLWGVNAHVRQSNERVVMVMLLERAREARNHVESTGSCVGER